MVGNVERGRGEKADGDAIARAHAVYTPTALRFYDVVVHGLSNRIAWRCPTSRVVSLYEDNLSANHLEAGVGTGLFLDRAGKGFDRLVLADINEHCLDRSARRLARFRPQRVHANLLEPLPSDLVPSDLLPFDSVGLTYVLHCLPGRMEEKLVAVDHLKPLMGEGAVLFGATILGRGITPNPAARALLDLYNAKGVFNNRGDDLEALKTGLEQRFAVVEIEQRGLVALFRAR
ncbi:MAG TPA: class I SAM-dependent methyltransferase [Methyloceanibacter sp.]|nr:class I SAM-dependent methyltransferase [Methyloceanibacter sp.]